MRRPYRPPPFVTSCKLSFPFLSDWWSGSVSHPHGLLFSPFFRPSPVPIGPHSFGRRDAGLCSCGCWL
ncbi:hypothetical protein BDV29DRAFT_177131 [Aspergillus leporis]|uniref:Uncharacterized protein n=1 Tax=Aspergillus leporis TaxID=41062 RepID=A0A5N5WVL3_9EURO|nr:hypothetical protein BDV29DRAFT_177131 [Aspergillus leporis]